ncbi:MAG: 2-oxoglutarate dehydrogenase E1 component [Candidatus Midichloriaceae bacterium]|jgi:2-oxoglutarate dehydrogenase E1 component
MVSKSELFLFSQNATFLEELYEKYLENPQSVDDSWKEFFSDIEDGNTSHSGPSWLKKKNKIIGDFSDEKIATNEKPKSAQSSENNLLSLKIVKLIDAFRLYGHMAVKLDPLNLDPQPFPKELDYKSYGITDSDMDKVVYVGGAFSHNEMTFRNLNKYLINTYSSRFAVEFFHMENLEEREWLRVKLENDAGVIDFNNDKKSDILLSLMKVEMFEEYLHIKFPGAKRFSIEGAESTITAIEEVISRSTKGGVEEAIFGMAHRGRLSILTKILGKSYHAVFSEFKGGIFIPDDLNLPGDVKYHVGSSSDIEIDGKKIHLSLTPNPSHLEVVNPIVSGRVRAKQDLILDVDRKKVMGVLIHGDAAFSGQGSVMESLALSGTDAYDTGGIVHIVTNNQIGFTTDSSDGRSSRYCTDIAKMIAAPIFHVNGDDPEAVAYVSKIAAEYRLRFKKDILIDIVCYRRYGHNEGDEPMFTQPIMYRAIKKHNTPFEIYKEKLIKSQSIDVNIIQKERDKFKSFLDEEFSKSDSYKPKEADWLKGVWKGYDEFLNDGNRNILTGVNEKDLKELGGMVSSIPEDFNAHAKIQRLFKNRKEMTESGKKIDWGMGETLAYASLLNEGYNIRITGEDVKRGTFSHRHASIVDQDNQSQYIPLQNLEKSQNAHFEIHNSILSELAVVGFEYGYSYSSPKTLVIWEAQFGDFANSAQMVIDQYIASGKAKWLRMNGLVLLLPHGYEGQGPEHSSARLERYLQMCANDNMTIANCTTPASMFHLLRRQMHRNYRKPLIAMTPKSFLRHKLAVSNIEEFAEGTSFKLLIKDQNENKKAKKIVFCSGKVYYDLLEHREKQQDFDIALIRLEQLYPFPAKEITKELQKYSNIKELIWCQEEHKNMGAWSYIKHKFDDVLKDIEMKIEYVGREESASPAAGYMARHLQELNKFINKIFEKRS